MGNLPPPPHTAWTAIDISAQTTVSTKIGENTVISQGIKSKLFIGTVSTFIAATTEDIGIIDKSKMSSLKAVSVSVSFIL